MYTIRQILGNSIHLTVSGVKHNIAGIQNVYDKNNDKNVDVNDVVSANKSTADIRGDIAKLDEIIALSALESNTKDFEKAKAIKSALEAGLVVILRTAQDAEKKLKIEISAPKDKVVTLHKDTDGSLTLDTMLQLGANIDGGALESKNVLWLFQLFGKGEQKANFGELQAYDRLKANFKTKDELNSFASRIGATLPWNTSLDNISVYRDSQLKDFHRKFQKKVSEMATLGQLILGDKGAVSGLEAVLTGKEEQYKQNLLKDPNALKDAAVKVSKEPGGLEKFLSFLAQVGIMLPLNILGQYGIIATADTKSVDKKSGATGGLEHKFAQFGEAGNLSASIKGIGLQLDANTNDPSQRITMRTAKYLDEITRTKDPKNPIAAATDLVLSIKNENRNLKQEQLTKLSDINTDYIDLQNATIKMYEENKGSIQNAVYLDTLSDQTFRYLAEVEKLQGFQFKGAFLAATPGLIGVGLSMSKISTSYTAEGVNTAAALAEVAMTKEKFKNPTEKQTYLKSLGLGYEYNKSTKEEKLTLPASFADSLTQKIPGLTQVTDTSGNTILTFPKDTTFSVERIVHADGSTSISISPFPRVASAVVPANNAILSAPKIELSEVSQKVEKLRDTTTISTVDGQKIYELSRAKKGSDFDKVLVLIGEGNSVEAKKLLEGSKDKFLKKLAGISPLTLINTYTYGTRKGKSVDTLDQKAYSKERTEAVKNAEKALGEWNQGAEDFFSNAEKHDKKNLADTFSGQRLSVSVYATPKNGTHRIDTFDKSISVSDEIYTESFTDKQKDAILARSSITTQIAFDGFKSTFDKVLPKDFDIKQYQEMMKTGSVSPAMVQLGFTWSKMPQFYEARAMVQGNVCTNKVEGIAYGTLQFKGKTEVPPTTPSTENPESFGETGTGTTGVNGVVGINTIGAGIGVDTHTQKEPEKKPEEPTPEPVKPTPPGEKPVRPTPPGEKPVRTPVQDSITGTGPATDLTDATGEITNGVGGSGTINVTPPANVPANVPETVIVPE